MKKIIEIKSCLECPLINKCDSWRKLNAKQKFTLKTGVGIGDFILKGCKLKDAE